MGSIFRVVTRLTPAGLLPLKNALDSPKFETKDGEPLTGMDRVRKMYQMRNKDGVSMELNTVLQSSMTGAFVGACYGGFLRSRNAYFYFLENNEATIFKSTMAAKKKLQDYVTLAFCKGAFEWGWRMASFMGIFSLISTTIQVYRDKTSLLEYVVAGTITGSLYKFHQGPAAALVGAGLGAALSVVAGLVILLLLKVSGASMNDIRAALFKLREFREYHDNQAKEKVAKNKHDEVTRYHDRIVEEKGEIKVEDIN